MTDCSHLYGTDRAPSYRPLARYVILRVAHAPGMPGTFPPPPRVSDPDMHHGTCVRHVPWCMPGSLTSGFIWSRGRGIRSRHSRRMRNPQFYVPGKRLITWTSDGPIHRHIHAPHGYNTPIAKTLGSIWRESFEKTCCWIATCPQASHCPV